MSSSLDDYDEVIQKEREDVRSNDDGQIVFEFAPTDKEIRREKKEKDLFTLEKQSGALLSDIQKVQESLIKLGVEERQSTVYRLQSVLAFLTAIKYLQDHSDGFGRILFKHKKGDKSGKMSMWVIRNEAREKNEYDEDIESAKIKRVFLNENTI